MNSKAELGHHGENIAAEYLKNKGYKIIERNFRMLWGELDLIVLDPNKTLVFVEVKTVRQMSQNVDNQISAEDQLTRAKLAKLQRTASLYAGNKPELVDDDKGWRIDLLAITIEDKKYQIKHYKNI